MRYFKRENVVVPAEHPPLAVTDGSTFWVGDTKVGLDQICKAIAAGNTVSVDVIQADEWEECTLLDHRLYLASKEDPLESASRDDKAAMWALNHGTEHLLRLGGDWPEDGQSVEHIMSRDAKVAMVAKTQHWFHPKRPKQGDTNSTWSRWIMRVRRTEPFIYLGQI